MRKRRKKHKRPVPPADPARDGAMLRLMRWGIARMAKRNALVVEYRRLEREIAEQEQAAAAKVIEYVRAEERKRQAAPSGAAPDAPDEVPSA